MHWMNMSTCDMVVCNVTETIVRSVKIEENWKSLVWKSFAS